MSTTPTIDQTLRAYRASHVRMAEHISAKHEPRLPALAPEYVAVLHSVADFVDGARALGFSVGEAHAMLAAAIAPFASATMIETTE